MTTDADVRRAATRLEMLARTAVASQPSKRLALVALAELCEPLDWRERTGRNDNPLIHAVMRDRKGYAWCAGLTAHLSELVGLDLAMLGGFWRARSVDNCARAAMRAGTFLGHALRPIPGDLILYRTRAGSDVTYGVSATKQFRHIGIVTAVHDVASGPVRIITLEGNVSNDLRRRGTGVGSLSIGGFIRWPE